MPKNDENPNPLNNEQIVNLANELNNLKFFSDPIKFNSVIYQGVNMILEKIVKMENILEELQKKLGKNDGPKKEE